MPFDGKCGVFEVQKTQVNQKFLFFFLETKFLIKIYYDPTTTVLKSIFQLRFMIHVVLCEPQLSEEENSFGLAHSGSLIHSF